MHQCAVFVDAGYLFAQGSAALVGAKVERRQCSLDISAIVAKLKAIAQDRAPDVRLLRIYWYDGAVAGTGLTVEQTSLAGLDDIKIRLGFINSAGQQKGVDSLIVTDLIELARLKSISDAVLVSGDEDVRVGVQIAQAQGVRVHLVGLHPARGSQSRQLAFEADTCLEIGQADIASFLSVTNADTARMQPQIARPSSPTSATSAETIITQTIKAYLDTLKPEDQTGIAKALHDGQGTPPEHDRVMLGKCRDALGRQLERPEIKFMRADVRRHLPPHTNQ